MKPKRNIPSKLHKYKILKTYTLEKIFSILEDDSQLVYGKKNKNPYFQDGEYLVKLRRALIFKTTGIQCVCEKCTMSDHHFALSIDGGGGLHLDLYAHDELGELNMITIDHVHPKSKGGKNHISNYQTMCKLHNEIKSNKIR